MSDLWSHRIPGTALEVNCNLLDTQLVVRVNKGSTQIFRVVLEKATAPMTAEELMQFSPFSPDVRFKTGDMEEGLQRAMTIAGFARAG